jgi:hypothetical protein
MTTTVQHPETRDSKNWIVALIVTIAFGALLIILSFILKLSAQLPFPDPPGEVVLEAESGISDESGGGYLTSGGGSPQGDGAQQPETGGGATTTTTAPASDDGGNITDNNSENPVANSGSQSKPTNTPKASPALEKLLQSMNASSGSAATPTGNNGSGDPYSSGNGGGKGNGDGPGAGPGSGGPVGPGVGPGKGFTLIGRSLMNNPKLTNPTQEEGIVCVEIVVDRNGNVIKATAMSVGSTTTNSVLRSTARQNALLWKFNPDPKSDEEQIGKIFFNFSLK